MQFDGNNRLSNTNDFAAGTLFNGITFDSGSGPFILSGSTPNGNAVNLGGNITNNSINTQAINVPLVLTGTRTLTAATGNINIGGNIGETGGSQGVVIDGPGTVTFSGTNTYSGGTWVSSGTLIVTSANSLLDGSNLTIGATAGQYFSPVVSARIAPAAAVAVASAGRKTAAPKVLTARSPSRATVNAILPHRAVNVVLARRSAGELPRIAADFDTTWEDLRQKNNTSRLLPNVVWAQYGQ